MAALGNATPLLVTAVAPAASVAVVGIIAIVTSLLGIPFGGAVVAVVIGLASGLTVMWRLILRGRHSRSADAPWGRARRDVIGLVAGGAMISGATGISIRTWLGGLAGLSTPPQEHDMIIHTALTAYIARSGVGAPWKLLPVDVLSGGPVSFYPAGVHLLAATTADLTGGIVSSLNAMTVVFLSVALCGGTASLAFVAARKCDLSSGSACMAGGLAALVMAGSYRPAFHLMHDGGVLGNAAALALVPGLTAAALLLPQMSVRVAVVVGVAAAGAAWVHPTAIVSAGLVVAFWWIGQALTSEGRRDLRLGLVPLLIAVGVGAAVAAPALLPAATAAGQTTSFAPDTAPVSLRDAVGNTLTFPYGGYFDPYQARSQVFIMLVLAVGLIVLLLLRRGFGLVFAWAGWSLITIAAWASPAVGPHAIVTGFYYNAMMRVWSHVSLLAPVLGAVGGILLINWIAVLLRRRRLPLDATALATGLAVLVFVGYAAVPAADYAAVNAQRVASRYSDPDFVRMAAEDERAIAWLAPRVRPGERVLNSPNDGSDFLYIRAGVPVVNLYSLGVPSVPYSYQLLQKFNRYPRSEAVRDQLVDLNVAWVFVDSEAPTIGSAAAPEGWVGSDAFSVATGLQNLDGLPGLERVFRSGSVSVYALDLAVVGSL